MALEVDFSLCVVYPFSGIMGTLVVPKLRGFLRGFPRGLLRKFLRNFLGFLSLVIEIVFTNSMDMGIHYSVLFTKCETKLQISTSRL